MKLTPYLAALATLLLSAGSQAATQVSPKLKQNLEIMQNILQTSLEQGRDSGVGRISHSYLAGQGVLFQTSTQGSFGRYFAMAPIAPMAPMPPGGMSVPVAISIDKEQIAAISARASAVANAAMAGGHIDEEAIDAIAEQAEAEVEQMMDQQEQQQDIMRDVREQKRDLEREVREVEREKRDIEFQSKVGKLDAEQQKELTKLNSKGAELKKRMDEIQQKYSVMEQEYQKKRVEQAKIAAEKQKELIATISVNFANTLCDYGASLRELKDNEFVSLQLSNSHGRNSQDIYWVFKKSDINQCVTGKLNTESLLKKAEYYQY
ncbi:hypothetical protein A5320_03460 [Rheinheimera sp. SA_1]|jgi:hypothetical protein|uniref:hypothetical protein n=1 Tax=Rheinheimera sp. SA_1 TaxID=1827365 RepID=UPI0007FFF12D|nr:hypothetical protein [Rheinheimera sp. SA_1]OBP16476.1 hypothetical protein A5320_03460 [Rheinheimera sp. SA_1]